MFEVNYLPEKNQRSVLIFDFGVVLDKYGLWSGLIFKVGKAGKEGTVLAYGGRFDNLVGHYQLEMQKHLP